MPGLRADELPAETLYAGDVIEYYSMAFVCGDPRGHRVSTVLSVDDSPGEPFPISTDTGEMIPLTSMVKHHADRFGNRFKSSFAKWRKLRTFHLHAGRFQAPTRASSLNLALASAVDDAVAETRRQLAAAREEDGRSEVEHGAPAGIRSGGDDLFGSGVSEASSEQAFGQDQFPTPAVMSHVASTSPEYEEKCAIPVNSSPNVTINLVSSESDSDEVHGPANVRSTERESDEGELAEVLVPVHGQATQEEYEGEPTDVELQNLRGYLKTIPTRGEREKIRNQPKKRRIGWHVSRSRKRCHQAKCAITRSGTHIYHAKSLKAKKIKELLNFPLVKERLLNLHARRPVYKEAVADDRQQIAEVPWPKEVKYIEECIIPDGITFPDVGDFDKCKCQGDCFMDTCINVGCAIYCTPECCNLGAVCSNAPRARGTLKLFDTGRVGLGVYATTFLDVGDIIGEYAGKLSEYEALVPGQPDQAKKQNSEYTMLCNTKSARNMFVYIEALEHGFTTRFISHACDPNAAFVEVHNRTNVKVLVRMIKDVKAGAQITVDYGKERWFTCACDDCWKKKSN